MGNITFEEHDRMVRASWDIYDTIDFVPYFSICETLDELRMRLEEDYNNMPLTDNDVMKGQIFNVMSDTRLIQYLRNRYGDRFSVTEFTGYWIGYRKG